MIILLYKVSYHQVISPPPPFHRILPSYMILIFPMLKLKIKKFETPMVHFLLPLVCPICCQWALLNCMKYGFSVAVSGILIHKLHFVIWWSPRQFILRLWSHPRPNIERRLRISIFILPPISNSRPVSRNHLWKAVIHTRKPSLFLRREIFLL